MKYSISGVIQAWDGDKTIELIPDQEKTLEIEKQKYVVFQGEPWDKAKNAILYKYSTFVKIVFPSKIDWMPQMLGKHIEIGNIGFPQQPAFVAIDPNDKFLTLASEEPIVPTDENWAIFRK